jgi:hypothetical protein
MSKETCDKDARKVLADLIQKLEHKKIITRSEGEELRRRIGYMQP